MPQKKTQRPYPAWFERFRDTYRANIAHTFVLHGCTYDYIEGHKFLKSFLIEKITKNSSSRFHFIQYDRADGITFPSESDRQAFTETVGLGSNSQGSAFAGSPFAGGQEDVMFKDPSTAIDLIGSALKGGRFCLVIDYSETVFPRGDGSTMDPADRKAIVSLLKWAKDTPQIKDNGCLIFLITTELARLSTSITAPSSRIESIGIPYPDPDQRLAFINDTITSYQEEQNVRFRFDQTFDEGVMTRTTAGLAKVHILDIFQRARLEEGRLGIDLVRKRKEDIISAEFKEVLQILEPTHGFELIGGYDHVKLFFKKNVLDAVRSGNRRRVPMGILLMGPAGTGKSIFAHALAYECGVNFVTLNVGRIKERWVGSTEENIERAFWAIKSIRPCIVFLDEIDTALSRENHGDSGVSNNLMKRMLEFMSDTSHRGEVVFLAATNRPENIDFALKRTGRFDRKIPILPPTAEERPAIFRAMLAKHDISHDITGEELESLSTQSTGDSGHWEGNSNLVGSDIEAIVLKGYELAEDAGRDTMTLADLKEAVSLIRRSTQDVHAMVRAAISECNDLSLLPKPYRDRAKREKDNAEKDPTALRDL
jgi:transitional endoplasmic reticulum ATPase